MYLIREWHWAFVISLRGVVTLGGRRVRFGAVERRSYVAYGEVMHHEYRMPLTRSWRRPAVGWP